MSEATQRRPLNRIKPSAKDDAYEHHSELLISTGHPSKAHYQGLATDRHSESKTNVTAKDIEQEISLLRRERTHILDLLSFNWNRSNIWVELTEAKLNYIIGETGKDSCFISLSPVLVCRARLPLERFIFSDTSQLSE